MGKDIKEKYERVCSIKDKAISLVETQLNGDLTQVDAKELGEVADIAKDMAEIMKLCSEAEYYCKVAEAMDDASPEEKSYQLNKYIPEYEGKFYTPMTMTRQRDSRGRYMYTEPMWHEDESYKDRMYYSSMNGGSSGNNSSMNYAARDYREGRSPMIRRTYMELKENGKDATKELEHFMDEMATDITEMVEKMTPQERATLKQRLVTLSTKIA